MSSFIDDAINTFDRTLRSLTRTNQRATRPCPEPEQDNLVPLSVTEKAHSAGLMRVNHAGEVCAQALYLGQALTAKLSYVREEMEVAAAEEIDHLVWCEQRLSDLDSEPSLLNPLWYSLSFGIGACTGAINDRVSLGFVAATEELVSAHLQDHLTRLPPADETSKAIVSQMLTDERRHAQSALEAGGLEFPVAVKRVMSSVSKLMTSLSYRI